MNIRIEVGSLNRKEITGVGYYTLGLIQALEKINNVHIDAFLLRSPAGKDLPVTQSETLSIYEIPTSQKTYRKLHQFGLASVFDTKMPPADVTIFPDFALWPTSNSKINAVIIHDLTFIKHPEYMRSRSFARFHIPVTTWYLSNVVRRAVKKADFIITVSNSIKEDLISLLNVDPSRIIVTPIPPSDDFINPVKHHLNKKELYQKYDISTPYYILSVGTIEPRKNQLSILRAYLQLPKEDRSKYSLVFAGGYGWSNYIFLEEFKKAKNIGENVILTGYFDSKDSYSLYKYASLFTAASHYEGFGMPIMEAIATGTPPLLANIPIFKEVAGDAAMYVDVSKPKIYSRSMEQLLHDHKLRKHLINQGSDRKYIYNWQDNAITLMNHFYKKIKASEKLQ